MIMVEDITVGAAVEQGVVPGPTRLGAIEAEIAAKHQADVIRFRTCCADPRASK